MESLPPTTLPTFSRAASGAPATEPDVQGIPAVLVWALGGMAVLMCLVAVGIGLGCYWSELHMAVKVTSLLLVPAMLWTGYAVASNRGFHSAEVMAVFICLTWLVVLVLVQCCIYALPLWQMGLLYVLGLLVLPLVHPWRSAMLALGVGCMGELGLLWWAAAGQGAELSYEGVWMCLLSSLMLWSLGGVWCRLSKRNGYAGFGRLGSICFALFLGAFYALIILPGILMPVSSHLGIAECACLTALWVLPLLLGLPLHMRFARQQHCAVFSQALLAFGGLSLLAVPLVVLLNLPLLSAGLAFVYAASIVYYGANYKCPWLVLAGCVAFFLSSFCIPLLLGVNPLGSAVILLMLGGIFLYAAFYLSARRRRLLAMVQVARCKQQQDKPVEP
ncbi:MAG: hypothetical protein II295_11020 [Akkermansia sp.]|nr:hypothetical protein [Akkermansia sp.]